MSSLHSVWNFLCRFKYWVIFGFAVLIIGFVDENSILNRSQRWQTIAELRREISDYESRFEAASRMIESLDKEPGKLEQLAHEKYFMKRAEEDVFVIREVHPDDPDDPDDTDTLTQDSVAHEGVE